MWRSTEPQTKIASYALLCQFYPDFFNLVGDSYALDLRGNEIFWEMILEGMLSTETFTKKRSIYLLKRTIDLTKNAPDITPTQWTK
jgi:hypothetical protein